jgi:hypothetical protein
MDPILTESVEAEDEIEDTDPLINRLIRKMSSYKSVTIVNLPPENFDKANYQTRQPQTSMSSENAVVSDFRNLKVYQLPKLVNNSSNFNSVTNNKNLAPVN